MPDIDRLGRRRRVVRACLAGLWLAASAMVHAQEGTAVARPAPDLSVPAQDDEFALLERSGPWDRPWAGVLPADDRAFMQMLAQQRWDQARAWLKDKRPRVNIADAFGATPLTLAARAGQVAMVQELLDRGADQDARGVDGLTPLAAAAGADSDLVVQELLRHGADPRVLSRGDATPLHLAARAGSVGAIRTLLQADPQALDAPDARGRHPLAVAAQYGQLAAMQALVDAGLAVNTPCFYGVTALHYAALARQPAAVSWLRAHGARSTSVLTDVLIEKMSEPLVLPPVQP